VCVCVYDLSAYCGHVKQRVLVMNFAQIFRFHMKNLQNSQLALIDRFLKIVIIRY